MATKNYYNKWEYNGTPVAQNACIKCPEGATCPGGTQAPQGLEEDNSKDCGEDYAGSLYQKMVKYATQVCVRPSDYDAIVTGEKSIPTTVLEDVNIVMDSIRVDMAKTLSAECERLGGTWVDTQWAADTDSEQNKAGHRLFKYFYDETGANTKWGYCADPESVSTATLGL